MHKYPALKINIGHLRDNIELTVKNCAKYGVGVTGVIKGMNGLPELTKVFGESGVDMIGSSRIEQIKDAVRMGIDKPFMMIRIPMISEVEEVVEYCDYSLESDDSVLMELDRAAGKLGKKHKVVLMVEVGDLREGYYGEEALLNAAIMVENDLANLELAGVGMNVGCYGSILPTREKLDELVGFAEKIEEKIGRKLEMISGGATSSLMRIFDGDIPERVNNLRIGEGILMPQDLTIFYGLAMEGYHTDIFTAQAEVIEIKDKPTHPFGEVGRDAFGRIREYEDRGIRKRALVALGKVDYGDENEIFPLKDGIKVLGASSDHTILDVEDFCSDAGSGSGDGLKVGDIVEFELRYASLVFMTQSRNVERVFV